MSLVKMLDFMKGSRIISKNGIPILSKHGTLKTTELMRKLCDKIYIGGKVHMVLFGLQRKKP